MAISEKILGPWCQQGMNAVIEKDRFGVNASEQKCANNSKLCRTFPSLIFFPSARAVCFSFCYSLCVLLLILLSLSLLHCNALLSLSFSEFCGWCCTLTAVIVDGSTAIAVLHCIFVHFTIATLSAIQYALPFNVLLVFFSSVSKVLCV